MGFYETIIVFVILQMINVILNTAKSLIMARMDNPHISAGINAITFGFYVAVVKQIASLDLTVTIIVTIITNIIGVYITYYIARKLKKDDLWKIEMYIADSDDYKFAIKILTRQDIPFNEINNNFITVYCYSQEHSTIVHNILKSSQYPIKYNITEITKSFN